MLKKFWPKNFKQKKYNAILEFVKYFFHKYLFWKNNIQKLSLICNKIVNFLKKYTSI